jgi:hypothetical protein
LPGRGNAKVVAMSWYRNLSRRDFLKTAATSAVASGAIS